eukprot:TRINITY_DN7957_c0_g1_i1.p1 TRINITY_DN7957_c0_g1~~TRINITY_DN7957_c0_g1_i1.p1  ORF type:complete len:268 (+),score=33.85 TRINITY_DN7957_c0_g1_i1:69-806(+)
MSKAYAKRGLVCVAISYRLGSHVHSITDLAWAVSWVLNHISGFGGDPSKIFLSGHSAGGHLVSLFVSHPEYYKMVSIPPNAIKGVISISGIYTVGSPLSPFPNDMSNTLYRSVYITKTFGRDPQTWTDASPYHQVQNFHTHNQLPPPLDTDTDNLNQEEEEAQAIALSQALAQKHRTLPPFCLFNASFDLGLEFDGKRFYELLLERNHFVKYHMIPSTHGRITKSHIVANKCVEFIKEVLQVIGE